jgi:hypothetical protein
MTWVKFDDQAAFHEKVISAGNEAAGAWWRMGCWSSAHLTDGRIPSGIAALIAGRAEVLDALVSVRLLDRVGDDFEIHNYLRWNPSAKAVKAKRKADLERKGFHGNSKRKPNGIQTDSSYPVPVPVPVPETLKTLAPSERFDLVALYVSYPRKVGKAAGLKRLAGLVKTEADYEAVKAGIARLVADVRARGTAPEYIPHFSTWVNGRRWEDSADTAPQGPARDSKGIAQPYMVPVTGIVHPLGRVKLT